jgi:hypothetical protein
MRSRLVTKLDPFENGSRRQLLHASVCVAAAVGMWACGSPDPATQARGASSTPHAAAAGSAALGTLASSGSGANPSMSAAPENGGLIPPSMRAPGNAPSAPNVANPACLQDIDLVFVLDISSSMLGFFQKLDEEIVALDNALKALQLPTPPQYGLVVFVDDVKVVQDGQPYLRIEDLQAAFVMWRQAAPLGQISNPGEINATLTENGLDALFAAATSFHFRPPEHTQRMIVHVSDDAFWDGPAAMTGCDFGLGGGCQTTGSMHRYDEVVDVLRNAKIWTSGFVSSAGGHGIRSVNASGDGGAGFLRDYQGKPSIPKATGGLAFELPDVLAGKASLADSIHAAAQKGHCEKFPELL